MAESILVSQVSVKLDSQEAGQRSNISRGCSRAIRGMSRKPRDLEEW